MLLRNPFSQDFAHRVGVLRGSTRIWGESWLQQRRSSSTTPHFNTEGDSHSIAQETEDVTLMDRLMKVVRSKSNPAYHRIMPLRVPMLWSETLLRDASSYALQNQQQRREPTAQLIQDLPTRCMGDSYSELVLPFATSPELLEQYTNSSGGIRMGKLMEHLDSLAGSIAYKHILGPNVETLGKIHERGFYIVTASVDRLDSLAPLDPSRNLRISGQVIYTGRSSMEVAVRMESLNATNQEKSVKTVLLGRFSMVCRDAYTHRARVVNTLVPESDEEQALFDMGEKLKRRRQNLAQRSLYRVPPSSSEATALHDFWLNYGRERTAAGTSGNESDKGDRNGTAGEVERVWMGDSRIEKCLLMFPQERNVHSKVFGGYLMRLAYELGYTNAALFTRSGPGRGGVRFLSLDGLSFARPVSIGSILRLESQVLYSEVQGARLHCGEVEGQSESESDGMIVHVGVKATVVDPRTGKEQLTNDFRFTWVREWGFEIATFGSDPVPEIPEAQKVVRMVVPRTYQEAMLWLEGRRALEVGDAIRMLRAKAKA